MSEIFSWKSQSDAADYLIKPGLSNAKGLIVDISSGVMIWVMRNIWAEFIVNDAENCGSAVRTEQSWKGLKMCGSRILLTSLQITFKTEL